MGEHRRGRGITDKGRGYCESHYPLTNPKLAQEGDSASLLPTEYDTSVRAIPKRLPVTDPLRSL